MTVYGITRKAWFWGIGILLCFACIMFSIRYFSQALPLAQITISMDRSEALERARVITQKYHLGPQSFRQATSFETDTQAQIFVELEAGGKAAFNQMLVDKLYEPYTWHVRQFQESEHNEVTVTFTPQGKPYGFVETIAETVAGAQLTQSAARSVAESFAMQEWQVDFGSYSLAQASQEKRTGGRIDHTFVYERTDKHIGAGSYRLNIVVSGDKVSEITPFIKVPDDFSRRYQEMRATNNAVAGSAGILAFLLYILGGALFGFYFLSQSKAFMWRAPLIVAGIISGLQFAAAINNLPTAWLRYDTALSAHNFFFMYIIQAFIAALAGCTLLTLVLALAEGLTRRAFGSHPQLWKLWTMRAGSSTAVLGRTIAGYLFVGFNLALVICIYLFANKYLHWWWPTDILADPNILATRLPGLSSLSTALSAGFLEESLFRAIPLACAALLGNRYGKRSWWIAGAFIMQAFIFGAAHADYPAQPAYARLLELIVPSFIFGGMYLAFGLLPSILWHVIYDLVLMSLPLFVTRASGMWGHQLFIICAGLLPLIMITIARIRAGKFSSLDASFYNSAWQPPVTTTPTEKTLDPSPHKKTSSPKIKSSWLLVLAALGCTGWVALTRFRQDAPRLSLTREQAIERAYAELERTHIKLSAEWLALSLQIADQDSSPAHKFVWQTDKNLYKNLMGTYLLPPAWLVRFVHFNGSVEKRAEEYRVYITGKGEVVRLEHQMPEAAPGTAISQDKARALAEKECAHLFGLLPDELSFISAQADKKPHRTDWLVIFSHPTAFAHPQGQARVVVRINGDTISDAFRTVHVPEQWEREDRRQKNIMLFIRIICLFFLFIAGGIVVLRGRALRFSLQAMIAAFIFFVFAALVTTYNLWAEFIGQFNTSEPFGHQLFMLITSLSIGNLIRALLISLACGLVFSRAKTNSLLEYKFYLLAGSSLGFITLCVTSFIAKITPSQTPLWASYEAMKLHHIFSGTLIINVLSYVTAATFALLILNALIKVEQKWTLRGWIQGIIIITAGIAVSGIFVLPTVLSWCIAGILLGVLAWGAYYFMLRAHPLIIIPTIGTLLIGHSIKQAIFAAYPGTIVVHMGSIIVTAAVCILLMRYTQAE